jgi:L-rhamnose mutarotase
MLTGLPISHISPLPAVEFSTSFTVQWSGAESVGPGIQNYTIYVSDNGAPFTAWLTQTTATEGTFTGVSGHTYGFYSIAADSAGNVELPKTLAEATTYVDAVKPSSRVSALPGTESSPNFQVQWSGTDAGGPGIGNYSIYVSDNGGVFGLWLTNTAASAWYPGFLGHTYRFFSQATDVDGNVENLKTVADAATQTPATSPEDVNGDGQINCADVILVQASFGKKTGQPGFNPAADVNKDGVVNVLDLALVTQKLIPGTVCQ